MVAAAVAAAPGSTIMDVARALGVAHSTASYYVRRLRKEHLLRVVPDRGMVRVYPPPGGG